MALLPFTMLLGLLAAAALAAGLGYRRLGEDLAASTVLSPTTGLVAGAGALLVLMRIVYASYEPGLETLEPLFHGLIAASAATAILSIAFVLRRIGRNRTTYLLKSGRSWGLLLVGLTTAWAAVALGSI